MIVEVPFAHQATVQRPRRKKADTEWFSSKATLVVAEAKGSEAPVAMWWCSPSANKDHWRIDKSVQVAIRAFRGRLYEPIFARDGELKVTDDAVMAGAAKRNRGSSKAGWQPGLLTEAGLAAKLGNRSLEDPRHSRGNDAPPPLEDEAKKRSVVLWSNGEKAKAEVAAQVARTLVVDGVAYRDVGRPMYRREMTYRHQLGPICAVEPDFGWATAIRPEDYAAEVKAMRAEKLQVDAADLRALAPDVVDAALLEFDLDAWRVDGVARAILKGLAQTTNGSWGRHGTKLASFPKDVILAYGELRDAVNGDAGVAEQARLLAVFAEAAEPHGLLRDELAAARATVDRCAHLMDDASVLAAMAGP